MALYRVTIALYRVTIALYRVTMALQGVAKFNLLRKSLLHITFDYSPF
jgi:hypothetical protein